MGSGLVVTGRNSAHLLMLYAYFGILKVKASFTSQVVMVHKRRRCYPHTQMDRQDMFCLEPAGTRITLEDHIIY